MAVADFQNPKITQNYATLLQSIRDLVYSQALMHDGTGVVNAPTNCIRYSSTNKKWERFNGTAWVENSSSYNMSVSLLNGYGSSVPSVADTHVLRDSTGTIFVKFLNMSSAMVASGVTSLLCKAADDYVRTAPAVAVKAFLNYAGSEVSTLAGDRTRDIGVAQYLRWQNYGNSHILFDASSGLSPTGTTVSNTNSSTSWIPTHMSLMGWNGSATYGVRVDTARYSETTNPAAHRVQLNGLSAGSFGSISIRGSTNGYAGVRFDDVGASMMDSGTIAGYYQESPAKWIWQYNRSNSTFTVEGDFGATGNVTAYSDERLKKDWKPVVPDFVEKWAALKHGIYTRVDSGNISVGIGAQSLQKFLPEAITETPDGTLAVNYGGAVAVASIEVAKRVLELEQLVKILTDKLETFLNKGA